MRQLLSLSLILSEYSCLYLFWIERSGRSGRLLRNVTRLRRVGRPISTPNEAPAAIVTAISIARINNRVPSAAAGLAISAISPLYKVRPGISGTILALMIVWLGILVKRETTVAVKPTVNPATALAGIIIKPNSDTANYEIGRASCRERV